MCKQFSRGVNDDCKTGNLVTIEAKNNVQKFKQDNCNRKISMKETRVGYFTGNLSSLFQNVKKGSGLNTCVEKDILISQKVQSEISFNNKYYLIWLVKNFLLASVSFVIRKSI